MAAPLTPIDPDCTKCHEWNKLYTPMHDEHFHTSPHPLKRMFEEFVGIAINAGLSEVKRPKMFMNKAIVFTKS